MQEGIFLEADVHERGLEAVLQIADLALENAADEALLGGALDVEFLQLAVFEHGDARFERLGVDDDLLVDFVFRADEPLDLFDEVGGGLFDGVQHALGLVPEGHRLEFLFLLHLFGGVEDAARKSFFSARPAASTRSGAPAGGRPAATFSARSISCAWRFSNTRSLPPCSLTTSARACGFAVGLLRVGAEPPLGRNRIPRRRREKLLLLIESVSFRWMCTFCIKPTAINEPSTEDPP
jgi:hypothetical protein